MVPKLIHNMVVWSQSQYGSKIWSQSWHGQPQLVLWNIGMVGISYFGTLEQLVLWYGWDSWDRILESSLSASFLCQHHFFVNDTSLSASFLCQHHFFVSYMLLSATCYYQRHIFVNDTSLSVNHLCQSSVGME